MLFYEMVNNGIAYKGKDIFKAAENAYKTFKSKWWTGNEEQDKLMFPKIEMGYSFFNKYFDPCRNKNYNNTILHSEREYFLNTNGFGEVFPLRK